MAAGFRGISSVGRAPALQAGGHEFESRILHLVRNHFTYEIKGMFLMNVMYLMYLENCTQRVIKLSIDNDIRFLMKEKF